MTEPQRTVYFRCIDLAAQGGFEYIGGSLGGGSMNFERRDAFVAQSMSLYLDWTGRVNVAVYVMRGIDGFGPNGPTPAVEKVMLDYMAELVQSTVSQILGRPEGERIELRLEDCVLRFEQSSFVVETDFSRVRSYMALGLDVCDDVSRFIALQAR